MKYKSGCGGGGGRNMLSKLFQTERMLGSEDDLSSPTSPVYFSDRNPTSTDSSPSAYEMSPWNNPTSPYLKSPWTLAPPAQPFPGDPTTGLLGSLVREEGHVYSLAAAGGLLYTGSDSKNIRVWKGRKESSGFKSNSGLVKAIVVAGDRVFTGHQDGKIRIWRVSAKNPSVHKRVGTLPSLKDSLKRSVNPGNYVQVRRHRNVVWLRHFDAVSSLSLDHEQGLLYSGSWDKTFKVWRLSDSKCLESVVAHDDAINAVAVAPEGMVFTGSADGTVKLWRREAVGKGRTKHVLVRIMLRQESAVTALAVGSGGVYSGSSDGVVNYWKLRGWCRVEYGEMLRGHRMAVLCLAAAGRLVVSGSADKMVCVWLRGEDGKHRKLAALTAHAGPVKCLAVEEEGDGGESGRGRWVVYSGSLDRSVNIWRVSEKGPEGSGLRRSPVHVGKRPGTWEMY